MTEGRSCCMVRSSSIKKRWLFLWNIWKSASKPGSNVHKAKKLWPDTGAAERNINYFTCLVSTVDIQGGLLISDV